MGIRIHKTLGYGFQYCKYGKDPRFVDGFFDSDDYWERDLREEMIEACQAEQDRWLYSFLRKELEDHDKILSSSDLVSYSAFDHERGCGPICFTDPFCSRWHRYDDTIDYYDCDEQKDSVKLLRDEAGHFYGIYPYNSSYVNRKTGERIKGLTPWERWSLSLAFQKTDGDFESEWQGIGSKLEFYRDIMPDLSPIIKIFNKVAKPFKDPLTVHRLKPMVLTYWS